MISDVIAILGSQSEQCAEVHWRLITLAGRLVTSFNLFPFSLARLASSL
jgi:hypothetical protein